MDFFQNGTITTLHRLCRRSIDDIEAELETFAIERPMALILPSLYSELEGDALPRIVDELKQARYISEIIVGLDQADAEQFAHAKAFFADLPQRGYDPDRARFHLKKAGAEGLKVKLHAADAAFAGAVERFHMPRELPEALLEGFEWDADGRSYDDISGVYAYSARVAAARVRRTAKRVGRMRMNRWGNCRGTLTQVWPGRKCNFSPSWARETLSGSRAEVSS